MRSDRGQDHTHLARLARSRDAELRPLLLRVQTRTFADAPTRDSGILSNFQAIALGLIPLVPDDVLAETAAILRGIPDTPSAVLNALEKRLVRTDENAGSAPAPDHARSVACNRLTAWSPDLHAAALEPDPDGRDRETEPGRDLSAAGEAGSVTSPNPLKTAARYRRLDDRARVALREDLGPALEAAQAGSPMRLSRAPAALFAAVSRGDFEPVWHEAARILGLPAGCRFDLRSPVEQEFLVFALLTLGLEPDAIVRALLVVDEHLSRSVPDVFRLAGLARSTLPSVAFFLIASDVGGRNAGRGDRGSERRPAFSVAAGQLRADGRADPVIAPRPASPGAKASENTVRFGHRSRPTTGLRRT